MPALYQSPFFYERTFFICPELRKNYPRSSYCSGGVSLFFRFLDLANDGQGINTLTGVVVRESGLYSLFSKD